jgi:hypothetical protein
MSCAMVGLISGQRLSRNETRFQSRVPFGNTLLYNLAILRGAILQSNRSILRAD